MTATDAERNSWVNAVSAGRTDSGLEEWLASDVSLPYDNVIVVLVGRYPMVRVSGYWYQVAHGTGFDGATLTLITDSERIDWNLGQAKAIIDRTGKIIRGSLDA